MCHKSYKIYNHILSILPHYNRKFKVKMCRKSGRICKQNASIFKCTHFNAVTLNIYHLFTRYFIFLVHLGTEHWHRHSACCMFGVASLRSLTTMWLKSVVRIFKHLYTQIVETLSNYYDISISIFQLDSHMTRNISLYKNMLVATIFNMYLL